MADDVRALEPSLASRLDERLRLVRDAELRRGLIELFVRAQEMIDGDGVNLVVLAARRLACIYQLLIAAGMPPLRDCLVVSDRFVDTRPALQWKTRRVLILDDSIVVGTTLRTLSGRLAQFVGTADAVRSLAVCLDRDQHAAYLLASIRVKALYERRADELRAFSEDLVKTLFENQIPFFSDFPVTQPYEISSNDLDRLLATPNWEVADVTAPLFVDGSRRALSLVPTDETFSRLLARIPPDVGRVVDGFKVRLYVADEVHRYRVVIVPLGLIAASTPAALDTALESVSASATRTKDSHVLAKICSEWRPEAKHRLVQLYLSACVLAEAWTSLAGLPDRIITGGDLDRVQTDLYFGPSSGAVLHAFDRIVGRYMQAPVGVEPALAPSVSEPPASPLLDKSDLRRLLLENRDLIAYDGTPLQPSQGQLSRLGFVFAHAVCSVFGYISREYELKERKEILGFASVAEYEERFGTFASAGEPGSWVEDDGRVIHKGLTLRELSTSLTPSDVGGRRWARSLVSLGIDAANDLGVVVPQTRYSEARDLAFRSYRIGETAHLADRPLREAFREEILDALTVEGAASEPITPSVVEVASWRDQLSNRGELSDDDRERWLKDLRSRVRQRLPGEIESQVEGRIDEVTERTIEATIIDEEGDLVHARLNPNQIAQAQAADARPGTLFTWTVFSEDANGARRRISEVRLYPLPELGLEQMERSQSATGQLAESGA